MNGTPRFVVLPCLGLIFVTLKLCNAVTWSWWWVLAPFWVPLGLIAVFGVLLAYENDDFDTTR